ncbi:MAG: FtsX-like permease family protein [Deltaproteobacteria bacterium]|nr:FtsX-like permease family protein [Deltaproteobacteria bacterium]
MIRFLLKGLMRDRNRSLFPVLTVALGVMLTVLVSCWVRGIIGDVVDFNARFSTGHVKIVTRAYSEEMDQIPNDLALDNIDGLTAKLAQQFPTMKWVSRIRFGGLMDVPDETGETRAQGPAMGLAIDLLSSRSGEIKRMNISKSVVTGSLPKQPGEILLSNLFANQLGVTPGDRVTLLTATMHGSMAITNFTVAGTVVLGVMAMDRGMVIMDLTDAQRMLDMSDSAGEILGYFPRRGYDTQRADMTTNRFNGAFSDPNDVFSPIMIKLEDQNDLGSILFFTSRISGIVTAFFLMVMSVVLWNAGLLGGLRRYGEMGVRLAIGEDKGHVYRTLVTESVLIGLIGSILGTALGLFFAYLLETIGIDIGKMVKNPGAMMMPTVFRAHVTTQAFYIGFIPGLLSTILGTMLSGIGIYKRKTAQLFKELEA